MNTITWIGVGLIAIGTAMSIYGQWKDGQNESIELKGRLDLITGKFLNEGRVRETVQQVNEKFDSSFPDNNTKIKYLQAEDTLLLRYKSEFGLTRFETKQSINLEGNSFMLDAIGNNEETGPDCINYYFYVIYNNTDSLSQNSQRWIHAFDAFFDNYRQRLNPTHQQHKAVLLVICKDSTGIEQQIEELFYQYNRPPIFTSYVHKLADINS